MSPLVKDGGRSAVRDGVSLTVVSLRRRQDGVKEDVSDASLLGPGTFQKVSVPFLRPLGRGEVGGDSPGERGCELRSDTNHFLAAHLHRAGVGFYTSSERLLPEDVYLTLTSIGVPAPRGCTAPTVRTRESVVDNSRGLGCHWTPGRRGTAG